MEFNYQRDHSRALYAPAPMGNIKKGQVYWCHSKEDERTAKELGFTSERYVESAWPQTAWHKKTGETRAVGKLEWSDEQNAAAVKALGSDWGLEHVPVPDPPAKSASSEFSAADVSALASIVLADNRLLVKRLEELEEQMISQQEMLESLTSGAEKKKPEVAKQTKQ